jgi:hypothetical protein
VPILEVIARLHFRDARPQPWGAHQYTVRVPDDPQGEADYVALWTAIEAEGVFERWRARKKKYLYPGDGWKYWHMGPLYQSKIVNRMKIEDDLDRLRREG